MKIEFKKGKETKGTFVFNAVQEDAPVTTLYVQKGLPDELEKNDELVMELKPK